jgi:hypothetical protein
MLIKSEIVLPGVYVIAYDSQSELMGRSIITYLPEDIECVLSLRAKSNHKKEMPPAFKVR